MEAGQFRMGVFIAEAIALGNRNFNRLGYAQAALGGESPESIRSLE
jgi:hypothetical protein